MLLLPSLWRQYAVSSTRAVHHNTVNDRTTCHTGLCCASLYPMQTASAITVTATSAVHFLVSRPFLTTSSEGLFVLPARSPSSHRHLFFPRQHRWFSPPVRQLSLSLSILQSFPSFSGSFRRYFPRICVFPGSPSVAILPTLCQVSQIQPPHVDALTVCFCFRLRLDSTQLDSPCLACSQQPATNLR